MANPQPENGVTGIANEILEALWKINLTSYETRILLYLIRKTYGWHKKVDRISLSQFSKDVGIDRRLVHRTLKLLSSRKMITVIPGDDRTPVSYGFQKDYEKWVLSSNKMILSSNEIQSVISLDDDLSSNEIPTKEIKETNKRKKNIVASYTPEFETFWKEYPARNGKKQGKSEAFKEWKAINPSPELQSQLITAIKKQKATYAAVKATGQFIAEFKDPCRWLKGRRWEDEIISPEEAWKENLRSSL